VDNVADISPVRALRQLDSLVCFGTDPGICKLSDLSPIQGMHLTVLHFVNSKVASLLPLKGMSLSQLYCHSTNISDLSPLEGMPLTVLNCGTTGVRDLSPLKGMPLTVLTCDNTLVTDLSPLQGMHLAEIELSPANITDGMEILRQMKSLGTIGLRGNGEKFSTTVFWKKYDAGEFGKQNAVLPPVRKPVLALNDFAFQQWMKAVAGLPADQQVLAVAKKLQELNPGFDGTVVPAVESGVVTELKFAADNVTDISPVHALGGLKRLKCAGSAKDKGMLADLSPLAGMQLTFLNCGWTKVSDLSPLKGMHLTELSCSGTLVHELSPLTGMPLSRLNCGGTQVFDLTPLEGMPLTNLTCDATRITSLVPLHGMPLERLNCSQIPRLSDLTPLAGIRLTKLSCNSTAVADLSPIKGMPLKILFCSNTRITDLGPLEGMSLVEVAFTPSDIQVRLDILRHMATLKKIRLTPFEAAQAPGDFWKQYDAAMFGKPDASTARQGKTIAALRDPAIRTWARDVAALPAEQQINAVVKKLQQLNPAFDGKEKHKIEAGVVTQLDFCTDDMADISPVRALSALKHLSFHGSYPGASPLSDLTPLEGLRLTRFDCMSVQVSDLSPLRDMPLDRLACSYTRVADLSPLKGMSLTTLYCHDTKISDLSPLKGLPLRTLHFEHTNVSDLSALKGLELVDVSFSPRKIRGGMDILRRMPSVQTIHSPMNQASMSPQQFWQRYDAGAFTEDQADAAFFEFDGFNGFWGGPEAPEGAYKLLEKVQKGNNEELKCFAFGPGRDWMFLFGGNGFYSSADLPPCKKLADLWKEPGGANFKCVAIAPNGGCTVLWNRNENWSKGRVPDGAIRKMQEVASRGGTLRSVAYGPGGAWVVMFDESGVAHGDVPKGLAKVLDDAVKNNLAVRCVDFTERDWLCLTDGGWSASDSNLPAVKRIDENIKAGHSPKWIAIQPSPDYWNIDQDRRPGAKPEEPAAQPPAKKNSIAFPAAK
jgi:Leucine-rich repeat (LRR) protein